MTKKVIDVAGPEDAKIEIGSKPMIVGHKSVAADPMMREDTIVKSNETETDSETESESESDTDTDTNSEIESQPVLEAPSIKQKTIIPLEKSVEAEDEKKNNDLVNQPDENDNLNVTSKTVVSSEKEDQKLDPTAAAMEREENLRKMIESKKYNVSIKQTSNLNKPLIVVISGLLIAGLLGLIVAIDMGKIDLGFELPFSFFNNTKASPPASDVVEEPSLKPVIINTEITDNTKLASADTPEGYTLFDGTEYGFTFSYPSAYGSVKKNETVTDREAFSFSNNDSFSFSVNKRNRKGASGHDDPTLNIQNYKQYPADKSYVLLYLEPDSISTSEEKSNVLFSSDDPANSYIVFEGAGINYFISSVAKINSSNLYESVVFDYFDSKARDSPYVAADAVSLDLKSMLDTFRTRLTQ